MNIPSKFKSQSIESKWYKYWQKNGYFRSKPDKRKPYTIVIPPPNVTGVLHMGHMLNNSLQGGCRKSTGLFLRPSYPFLSFS